MRLLLVLLGLLIFLKISEYVHATIFLESLEKLVCFLLLVLLIFPLLGRFSRINWSLDINWLSVFLTEVRGNLGVINAFVSQSLHSFLPSITIWTDVFEFRFFHFTAHYFVEFVFIDLIPELVLSNCIKNQCPKLSRDTARNLLEYLVLHVSLVWILNDSTFSDGKIISLQYLLNEQLGNRHPLFERTETNLVSHFDDHILEVNLTINSVLTLLLNLLLLGVGDNLASLLRLQLSDFLAAQSPNKRLCRATLSIKRLKRIDKEFQEHIHLRLTANYKIDIAMFQLKSNAIPTIEWK